MNWRVFKVHLNDEIPLVGAGQRLVEAQVGHKWVYVRRHPARINRKSRIRRALWDALEPKEEPNECAR